MNKKAKLLALGLALSGLAFAGPSDNSLVIGTSQEPPSLGGDVLNLDSAAIKSEIENYLIAPLAVYDASSKLIPVQITQLPTLANKRLRTFKGSKPGTRRIEMDITFKKGLKWSDGKPITTADVLFLFQLGNAKGIAVPTDTFKRTSVQAKDQYNFTLNIEPAYYYDAELTLAGSLTAPAHIMKPEYLKAAAAVKPLNVNTDAEKISEIYTNYFQKFSSNAAINAGKMVYSGPFKVSKWTAGSSIELVRNKYFPLTPAGGVSKYVQKVTYRIIGDTNALLIAAIGGGVDALSSVGITGDQATSQQAKANSKGKYDIWGIPGAVWEHIEVNKFASVEAIQNLGLNDKRTRQAMLYSLNRDAWVKAFFGGAEPVANTWIAPVNSLWADVKKYPYDLAKATALLKELGWTKGSDGILERTVNGKKVKFEIELTTTAGNAVRERSQQFFIDQWKQVGISVKPANASPAVVFDDAFIAHAEDGKWQMFMFAFSSSPAEDGGLFYYKNVNTGQENVPSKASNYSGQNYGGWRNDEFDKLVGAGSVEFDPTKRKAIFAKAQALWADEVPTLPLRFRSNYYIVKTGLVNYVASTYSGLFGYPGWNSWEIGWASKGAVKKYDQGKFAIPIK